MIRNAVELTERWSALTGEPLPETRQRVKVLRVAGLLPDARIERDPLSDRQIAGFVIASLASEMKLGAAEVAQRYAALPPVEENEPTPLDGMNLGNALAELVRQEGSGGAWRLIQAEVNLTDPFVVLSVYKWNNGWLANSDVPALQSIRLGYGHDNPGDHRFPIERLTRFRGNLLRPLVRGSAR